MKRLKVSVAVALIISLFFAAFHLKNQAKDKAFSSNTEPESHTIADNSQSKLDRYLYEMRRTDIQMAVEDYFKKARLSGQYLGAGVSIVYGDSILYSNGFGKRHASKELGVDHNTIFRLGSISKGFTGVLAGSVKQQGKLSWDDRVSDFVQGFQLGNNNGCKDITLANILSHTSGTAYHSYTDLVESGMSLSDIAQRFKKVRPISKPGTLYSYQNAIFALSGEMIKSATGKDINNNLQERFFNPLNMESASCDYRSIASSDNVAYPHKKTRKYWRSIKLTDKYYNAVAAGGINASSSDMAKWMRFLLGHNPEVMSKSDLDEVFEPLVEVKGKNKYYQRWPGHKSSHYAYGWRIHKFEDSDKAEIKTIIHHGGSVNNYRNEIALFPDSDLGICVLFNSNTKLAKTVIPDLYEIVNSIINKPFDAMQQFPLASIHPNY